MAQDSPITHTPQSLEELLSYAQEYPQALWISEAHAPFASLVSSINITPKAPYYLVFGGIAALKEIRFLHNSLYIGIGASLINVWEALHQHYPAAFSTPLSDETKTLIPVITITMGDLMAHPVAINRWLDDTQKPPKDSKDAPSSIHTRVKTLLSFLVAIGAKVVLQQKKVEQNTTARLLSVEALYKNDLHLNINAGEVLTAIQLPVLEVHSRSTLMHSAAQTQERPTSKAKDKPLRLAHLLKNDSLITTECGPVAASLYLEFSNVPPTHQTEVPHDWSISHARWVFAGLDGTPRPYRLSNAESLLICKAWRQETLDLALNQVKIDIQTHAAIHDKKACMNIIEQLLKKFFADT